MKKPDPLFMTVTDVIKAIRAAGGHIEFRSLNSMYDAGKAPFMTLVNVGPTGRRNYTILRKDFEAWLTAATEGVTL